MTTHRTYAYATSRPNPSARPLDHALELEVRDCVGAVRTPPCGVPAALRWTAPSCITPARNIARKSFRTWRSLIRSSIADINPECGIASKQLAMSVSTTHRLPCQD